MHRYEARITWSRNGALFSDNRYSRAHEWAFDGGIKVAASASPQVVRAPYSIAAAVDPEEALVASASSCHMLSFLFIAAKHGFVVENYADDACGVMGKIEQGKLLMVRITLRPSVEFAGERKPSPEELQALHHSAHEECYIANSLRSEIVVASPGERA